MAKPNCHAIFSFFILLNHLLIKKEKERERERERGDKMKGKIIKELL
jgi:hypothetical protein